MDQFVSKDQLSVRAERRTRKVLLALRMIFERKLGKK